MPNTWLFPSACAAISTAVGVSSLRSVVADVDPVVPGSATAPPAAVVVVAAPPEVDVAPVVVPVDPELVVLDPALVVVPGATASSPQGVAVTFWHGSGSGATWARWLAARLPLTKVGLSQLARFCEGFLMFTP